MESRVLDILRYSKEALSVDKLNNILGFSSVEEFKDLIKILNKLENEFKIYR
ncbi:MAG TPA: hypothetical protein GX747_03065, partial [Tenericutes bacterium]|nr:hypothetical protein [Mycoplasmatota bacterium]